MLSIEYQLLAYSVHSESLPDEMKNDPQFAEFRRKLDDDDFDQNLFSAYRSGKLTKDQLLFRLQEDAFWQARLIEWKTVGIAKLRKADDGSYTDENLEINDIRAETLEELRLGRTQGA